MSSTSSRPSVALRKATEPWIEPILRAISDATTALRIDYLVVGATARDLLLHHVHGFTRARATRDLDFAVSVEDWNRFEELKALLVQSDCFRAERRISHRLWFRLEASAVEIPLDLVPFGGVEERSGEIAWPPGREVVMSVAGFAEALACAVFLHFEGGLSVPVASLAGLTALKLLAWDDRHGVTKKDAVDLAELLRRYGDAGQEDRLYGPDFVVLEEADYSFELAGARLLGRDVAVLCDTPLRARIGGILANPEQRELLARHMGWAEEADEALDRRAAENLEWFHRGLLET